MDDLFEPLDQLARAGGAAAFAVLVSTRGTTPRKEGARMWVGEGGRILGSVTIGGCVDAQVIEEAEAVLAEGRSRLLELSLGDEEAWEIGLSCGGTVEVFIEPVGADRPEALALYQALRARVEKGGCGALVTLLEGRAAGAKLLLLDDGTVSGSLGDPALDAEARAVAQTVMGRGASCTVPLASPAGRIRAFVEVHAPPLTLVVIGAGHVAMALARLARPLGFRIVVVDARPRFATPERFPEVDQLLVGIPSEIVEAMPLTPATAVALVAHDYKFDLPILRHVLASPAGYVGMLGSSRRGKGILALLQEEGVPEEALRRVRVPIGLDLGGESAEEIALAILAEILSARYGGSGLPMREKKALHGKGAEPLREG